MANFVVVVGDFRTFLVGAGIAQGFRGSYFASVDRVWFCHRAGMLARIVGEY